MADPATVTLVVKAAVAAVTDKRTWKAIGTVAAAVLTPVILCILLVLSLLSAAAVHNNKTVELCFKEGTIPDNVPADYASHISDMRFSFSQLDTAASEISKQVENGSLDSVRIKAVFYSLFFGSENLRMDSADYRSFADCFVNYQKHSSTAENSSSNNSSEEYIEAVPLKSMPEIYKRLKKTLRRSITSEEQANASAVYSRVVYGKAISDEGDSFEWWEDWSPERFGDSNLGLPEGTLGADIVRRALTRVGDPYSQELRGTGKYTDCSYLAMWCYARAGISIPGTAAEQGKFCAENGLTVSEKELVPGDLIFWSYRPNGRFMNITHVGIYAGNGKVVDASSSKGQVMYRDLYCSDKQVLYGRPHISGVKK